MLRDTIGGQRVAVYLNQVVLPTVQRIGADPRVLFARLNFLLIRLQKWKFNGNKARHIVI